jgi:hypothetical protein
MAIESPPTSFTYERWRHGGWYVTNVRYPGGAVGCVSRNYPDKKWRIACDPRPFDEAPTFKTRDAAARAEWHLAHRVGEAERHTLKVLSLSDARAECSCGAWFYAYTGTRTRLELERAFREYHLANVG